MNVDLIADYLNILIRYLVTKKKKQGASQYTNTSPAKGLEKIQKFLTTVFLNSDEHLREQFDRCNVVVITEEKDEITERMWRVLSFWCLSPGLQ